MMQGRYDPFLSLAETDLCYCGLMRGELPVWPPRQYDVEAIRKYQFACNIAIRCVGQTPKSFTIGMSSPGEETELLDWERLSFGGEIGFTVR